MKYCFTGFPLSGKTTLAKKLADKIGVDRVSTGDIARSLGMGLEDSIKTDDLSMLHDEEITKLALQAVLEDKIVDGFPRSITQFEKLKDLGVNFKIIFVTENPITVYERINERARTSGRPEDTPEIVSGRLRASLGFLKRITFDSNFNTNLVVFNSSLGFEELLRALEIK